MGIFRYDSNYAAPTKEQRERYMKGDREEHTFSDGKIVLIVYADAAYLKDDIDGVRILFTGAKDMQKIYEEVQRLADSHDQKEDYRDSFTTGRGDERLHPYSSPDRCEMCKNTGSEPAVPPIRLR